MIFPFSLCQKEANIIENMFGIYKSRNHLWHLKILRSFSLVYFFVTTSVKKSVWFCGFKVFHRVTPSLLLLFKHYFSSWYRSALVKACPLRMYQFLTYQAAFHVTYLQVLCWHVLNSSENSEENVGSCFLGSRKTRAKSCSKSSSSMVNLFVSYWVFSIV